jgi:Rod binding domain-containing protein
MSVAPISSPLTPAIHSPAHDLAALKRGNLSPEEQRAAVSGQFEAILMRQFLQDSIGSMMGGGKSGGGGGVYSYMLTDTLADKLTQGRGMGIAPMIAKQLTPRGAITSSANQEAKVP